MLRTVTTTVHLPRMLYLADESISELAVLNTVLLSARDTKSGAPQKQGSTPVDWAKLLVPALADQMELQPRTNGEVIEVAP